MLLTRILSAKAGWRPRSLGTPGRQWIGKNRRIRHVTQQMRRRERAKEQRISEVEEILQFSYLTKTEAKMSKEQEEQLEEKKNILLWQKRILGPDVFGLGTGKPSHLDHLLVTDRRRFKKE